MNTLQMKISLLGYIATFFTPILALKAQEPVDFVQDVKPILELNCVSCHREDKAKGKLRLDTAAEAFKSDDVIVNGANLKKVLSTTLRLSRLTTMRSCLRKILLSSHTHYQNSNKIYSSVGLPKWPEGVTLAPAKRLPKTLTFVDHIQPILGFNCVRCHREGNAKGKLRLDNKADSFKSEEVSLFKPLESTLYILTMMTTI